MSKPSRDHGIEHEPHLRGTDFTPDASEAKAAQRLHQDGADRPAQRARESVHEEPAFRVTPGVPIERDWLCEGCGFNLRGLRTGQPCPECGATTLLAPPIADDPQGYAAWLRERMAAMTESKAWLVVLTIALLGGPWAVLGALISTWGGVLAVVLVGPAVEEVMKIGLVALMIEVRPYVFRRPAHIFIAAAGSGLMFATLENLIYFFIYIPNPSPDLIAWRLVVCTALHVGCTAVAAVGAQRVWIRVVTELRPANGAPVHLPWLVLAIAIHGVYNAGVTLAALSGFDF